MNELKFLLRNKISVVINTLNEEKYLDRVLASVKPWVDEILICDMHSEDYSIKIAKKYGAKVVLHQRVLFVELARDFAISKASGEWILILDPDEEVPKRLAQKIKEYINSPDAADFVKISRKNIIFGKWMRNSMWWPDYNIRLFKKNAVSWKGVDIHRPPKTEGIGGEFEAIEELAIIHYHYNSISQFIERLNRYTTVQAEELYKKGQRFSRRDLLVVPFNEFLSRYFASEGYKDGLHGLVLSLLQGFSHLIMTLKLWELEKFPDQQINLVELEKEKTTLGKQLSYWFLHTQLSSNKLKSTVQKIKRKLS